MDTVNDADYFVKSGTAAGRFIEGSDLTPWSSEESLTYLTSKIGNYIQKKTPTATQNMKNIYQVQATSSTKPTLQITAQQNNQAMMSQPTKFQDASASNINFMTMSIDIERD